MIPIPKKHKIKKAKVASEDEEEKEVAEVPLEEDDVEKHTSKKKMKK